MADTKIEWADTRKGEHRVKTTRGYILVYCPSHPHAKSKGHVYEHRYIMEKSLHRFLSKTECVHHINGIKSDNRIENLEIVSQTKYASDHYKNYPQEMKNNRINKLVSATKKRKHPRKIIKCKCNCGAEIETPDAKGRPRQFVQGHNSKGKHWKWRKNGNY